MGRLRDATEGYQLLPALKELAMGLAYELETCDQRNMPALARQYRETMCKIDELEGGMDDGDEIAAIILRNRKPASD